MYAKIYENFVDETDVNYFLNDITNKFDKFHPNEMGPHRHFLRINGTEDFQDIHKKYFDKIANTLGIKSPEIDPLLGVLYSVINHDGRIHKHIDSQGIYESGNFVNYRVNILLQRDSGTGYDPIIRGVKHSVNVGDAWSFPASLYEHETEPVSGSKDRIVLQYGFILHKKEYERLFNAGELILSKRMKDYHAKNTRNGIARSRKDFFSQPAEIVPRK